MKTEWDYTDLAGTYDQRVDYSRDLVSQVIAFHGLLEGARVLDLGAGTGKLTKILTEFPFTVIASEPNDAMRSFGRKNVNRPNCNWIDSSAESVEIESDSIDSVWFGSSFNVINFDLSFKEISRYTKENAWLTCLWNHRDLGDPIQAEVESVIKRVIQGFSYGSRREDPSKIIEDSGMFGDVHYFSKGFTAKVKTITYLEAWKSHATLRRQCSSEAEFQKIIKGINDVVSGFDQFEVPYKTNLWTSRRISG